MHKADYDKILEEISEIVDEAVYTDGGHHKQWFLYQLALILKQNNIKDIDLDDIDEGIAP